MDHVGGSATGRVHFCNWLIKSHFFPIAYGHEDLPLIQWGRVIWEKYWGLTKINVTGVWKNGHIGTS
jgi:hypothetical protein